MALKRDAGVSAVETDESLATSDRYRILVIDDDPHSRDPLAEILTNAGYTVASASDGPGALDQCRRGEFEVALIDIALPGMDGYEVARSLREQYGKKVFLIAITGYGKDDHWRSAMEAGFDLHLTKPVFLDALLKFLDARRALSELSKST